MKTKVATLLLCTVLSCISSNVANAGEQNREVGTFRKIQVSAGIDVYFMQEKTQSIRVETKNVEADKVITEVKNETLVIKMKSHKGFSFGIGKKMSIKVYVSAPVLEGISTSGGSDFYADDLKSSDFSISSSGGADIHIGNLTVDGKTNISTSGGSDCNIKNLKTNVCNLASSGGSDIKIGIETSGNLTVAASGASDIKLSGKANSVWVAASGGADIDVRNLEYKQIDSKASGGADIHK
ncbi:MAG: DUF2807 domain-containing protein [Dysgonamonadaceae bacterium]|jgi:hypothetical protein|nr:DUF2807 domain-containing protein [Dysgonamonadaceae bacterium]